MACSRKPLQSLQLLNRPFESSVIGETIKAVPLQNKVSDSLPGSQNFDSVDLEFWEYFRQAAGWPGCLNAERRDVHTDVFVSICSNSKVDF